MTSLRIRILLDIVNTAKFWSRTRIVWHGRTYFGSERERYLIVRLNFTCMKRRGFILLVHMLRTLSRQVHV